MPNQSWNTNAAQKSAYNRTARDSDAHVEHRTAGAPRHIPNASHGSYGSSQAGPSSSPDSGRNEQAYQYQQYRAAQGRYLEEDVLTSDYKIREKKFFVVGRLLIVLWSEPSAETNSTAPSLNSQNGSVNHALTRGRFQELIHSKIRRFVIVRVGHNYCNAVPITTYRGRGVGHARVFKADHCIITSERGQVSGPQRNELPVGPEYGMRPLHVRATPDDPTDALDPMSRIDFGKLYTIHFNIRVKNFGKVHESFREDFWAQYQAVLNHDFTPGARTTPLTGHELQAAISRNQPQPGSSSQGQKAAMQVAFQNLCREHSPEEALRQIVATLMARGLTYDQANAEVKRNLSRN